MASRFSRLLVQAFIYLMAAVLAVLAVIALLTPGTPRTLWGWLITLLVGLVFWAGASRILDLFGGRDAESVRAMSGSRLTLALLVCAALALGIRAFLAGDGLLRAQFSDPAGGGNDPPTAEREE
ncbi:MAG TPA: hypothetical protein VEW03_08040 [Longimicrobiaceae bacterium]|nr:hypothetical protein [Longimicrobiaceae bacterium]